MPEDADIEVMEPEDTHPEAEHVHDGSDATEMFEHFVCWNVDVH